MQEQKSDQGSASPRFATSLFLGDEVNNFLGSSFQASKLLFPHKLASPQKKDERDATNLRFNPPPTLHPSTSKSFKYVMFSPITIGRIFCVPLFLCGLTACGGGGGNTGADGGGADGGGADGDGADGGASTCQPPSFSPPAPDEATAEAACLAYIDAICERSESCQAAINLLSNSYLDVPSCIAGERPLCTDLDLSGSIGHATNAAKCPQDVETVECGDLIQGPPDSCKSRYFPVPPAPAGCVPIGVGTTESEITGTETLRHGIELARTFCICFKQGDRVSLEVLPSGEMPVTDTRLGLVDGAGVTVAYDDDSGNFYRSKISDYLIPSDGPYMVVVSGAPLFNDPATGTFALTVETR